MERLTFEGNFCDIAQCRDSACKQDGTCTQKEVWKRLKAYEDTGLSPEKISWMKEVVEAAFDNDTSRIERAHNLHVADKDGRVVVLPCKVGDTIWRLKRTFETYPDRSKPYVEPDAFLLQDVWDAGKTVFLTREEAEKALEAMKDG
nr:MAG: hypothetical protein [Bacteriophage sp.]